MKKTEQFDFDKAHKDITHIFADMLRFADDRGDMKTMLAYIDCMLVIMAHIKKEFQ